MNNYQTYAIQLNQLAKFDQDMRQGQTEWDYQTDIDNTEQLKQIIANIGWPAPSKVGKEASFNAWLIAQHADHDVSFQKYCLQLIKSQYPSDIDPITVAYLEDRICVNIKQPQVYGTQIDIDPATGRIEPYEIEDRPHLDQRRSEMRLGPFAEYLTYCQQPGASFSEYLGTLTTDSPSIHDPQSSRG